MKVSIAAVSVWRFAQTEKLVAHKWESSYVSRPLHWRKRMRLPQQTSISFCLWPIYFTPNRYKTALWSSPLCLHLTRGLLNYLSAFPECPSWGHRENLVSPELPILFFYFLLSSVTTCSEGAWPSFFCIAHYYALKQFSIANKIFLWKGINLDKPVFSTACFCYFILPSQVLKPNT